MLSISQINRLKEAIALLPFDIQLLPKPAYFVGGIVRDSLLGRKGSYLDLDIVLPHNIIEIAQNIAEIYQAGFVILDPIREIARVVFPHITVDFARQEGDTLIKDLYRRDFTINAIAFDIHEQIIIDPLQGQEDLTSGLIKMISINNLKDDPLRLLRAYRQSVQLGFVIESNTRSAICQLALSIGEVAAERVQTELKYLLNLPQGINGLISAIEDGLIPVWFHHINNNSIAVLSNWENTVNLYDFNRDDEYLSIAKLTCLLSDDPKKADIELTNLKYSRQEIKSAIILIRNLAKLKSGKLSIREEYFLFKDVGLRFPALAILALASGINIEIISPLMEHYFNPDNQIAHPIPLL
ncbi:MAG TPA: CCA tRNA nucleotidyltransferase, partial [Allocoleopsis sp.]